MQPFNGLYSLTDHKKTPSDIPLSGMTSKFNVNLSDYNVDTHTNELLSIMTSHYLLSY